MKTPYIDLEELKKLKEENFKGRLAFIDKYTEWLKKHQIANGTLSRKKLLNNLSVPN